MSRFFARRVILRRIGRAARAEPPLFIKPQPENKFCPLRCARGIVSARRGFPKGAALVRELPASAPLWPHSLVTFLAGQESNTTALTEVLHSKSFPQPLWNVERISVEKTVIKHSSTGPVDKFYFSTFGLWRKNCCGSNEKGTFPHNFVLRLLRLKNL